MFSLTSACSEVSLVDHKQGYRFPPLTLMQYNSIFKIQHSSNEAFPIQRVTKIIVDMWHEHFVK